MGQTCFTASDHSSQEEQQYERKDEPPICRHDGSQRLLVLWVSEFVCVFFAKSFMGIRKE